MDNASARVRWQAAAAEGVTCRFADVVPGRYAVSVVHDLNNNRRVDTNLIGLPTEAWGSRMACVRRCAHPASTRQPSS